MNEQLIYSLVAGALSKMISDGVKMKNVADSTGLSSSTLYKFMRQDTLYPRFHTLMAVLEYIGFEISLTRKGQNDGLRSKYQSQQPATSRLL